MPEITSISARVRELDRKYLAYDAALKKWEKGDDSTMSEILHKEMCRLYAEYEELRDAPYEHLPMVERTGQ